MQAFWWKSQLTYYVCTMYSKLRVFRLGAFQYIWLPFAQKQIHVRLCVVCVADYYYVWLRNREFEFNGSNLRDTLVTTASARRSVGNREETIEILVSSGVTRLTASRTSLKSDPYVQWCIGGDYHADLLLGNTKSYMHEVTLLASNFIVSRQIT